MQWPILTASLALTRSCRLWIYVFFRDQGRRILIPSPSIQLYGPCQPVYTWSHHLSFMKSQHYLLLFCQLWLLSIYLQVWVYLKGNSLHIGLFMIIMSRSRTHKLVKSFAVNRIALLPTLIESFPANRLITLWHRYGDTICLFDIYTGYLKYG